MDHCAEATLRVVRLAQGRTSRELPDGAWYFMPAYRQLLWAEAVEALTSAAKPVVVAPLIEPGHIGVWSLSELPTPGGLGVIKQLSDQQTYFAAKLQALGLQAARGVEIPSLDGDHLMPMAEFTRWLAEYAVGVGSSLQRTADAEVARLTLRPPGGGGPPLGWKPEAPRVAS